MGLGPILVLQWTLPCPFNTPYMAHDKLAIFLHSMQQKWDQGTLGRQRSTLIGSRTRLGPSMDPANTPNMSLYILAIFLHSMQQKWDRLRLGTMGKRLDYDLEIRLRTNDKLFQASKEVQIWYTVSSKTRD